MCRPVLAANRWLEAEIAADPALLGREPSPGTFGGWNRRAVCRLFPEWLRRVEAETGFEQADPDRGFRKAVENAAGRIGKGSDNGRA